MITLLATTLLTLALQGVGSPVPSPEGASEGAPEGMVLVPAGEFVMGDDEGYFDERPAHRVEISAFWIDRCEVTNAEFARFVRENGKHLEIEGPWFRRSAEGCLDLLAHLEPTLGSQPGARYLPQDPDARSLELKLRALRASARAALREMLGAGYDFPGAAPVAEFAARPELQALVRAQANHPVRYVAWRDAAAFAQGAGKRLPTEAEWEKAARGTDQRGWPWGDTWTVDKCRIGIAPPLSAVFDPFAPETDAPSGPFAVGSFPTGASPYGCLDMAGNVWEWTADWYGEQAYRNRDGVLDPLGPEGLPDGRLPQPYSDSAHLRTGRQGRASDTRKVIRGGGWSGPPSQSPFNARTTRRLWSNPSYWHQDVGFRCVKSVEQ